MHFLCLPVPKSGRKLLATSANQVALAREVLAVMRMAVIWVAVIAGVEEVAVRGAEQRMAVEVRRTARIRRKGTPKPRRFAAMSMLERGWEAAAQAADAFAKHSAASLCTSLKAPMEANIVFEFIAVAFECFVAVKAVTMKSTAAILGGVVVRTLQVSAAAAGRGCAENWNIVLTCVWCRIRPLWALASSKEILTYLQYKYRGETKKSDRM